jgi:hypothetical protein
VVVGGGPVSVQFASELHELLHDLEHIFPKLKKRVKVPNCSVITDTKVTFVKTKEHQRNTYDSKISAYCILNYNVVEFDMT